MGSFINVDNDRCRRKLKAEKETFAQHLPPDPGQPRSIIANQNSSDFRAPVECLVVVYATLAVVCADRLVLLEQKRISKPIQLTLCRARLAHTHNFHSQKNHNARCIQPLTTSHEHSRTPSNKIMNETLWNLCAFSVSHSRGLLTGSKWIEKILSRVQHLLPLLNSKQQVQIAAPVDSERCLIFAGQKKRLLVVGKISQKRTRIMLMSLMISEMFHLLRVRASFPFLLSLCFFRGS